MQTITDDLFAHGLRTYIKAGFADDLPGGLIDVLLEHAASIRSPITQIELLALGGAIGRVAQNATAFPFRQARWLITSRPPGATPLTTRARSPGPAPPAPPSSRS
jgi:hypothetical protein